MTIREAAIDDIKQIQRVRNSVTENILSAPNIVIDKDCEELKMQESYRMIFNQNNSVLFLQLPVPVIVLIFYYARQQYAAGLAMILCKHL